MVVPVTAQEALRAALRDVLSPAAREHGYRGSAPTWRKGSEAGDWAVVNVQSSRGSTSDGVACVVNLAFAPEPWLRWLRESLGAGWPKSIVESLGLHRERLGPAGAPQAGPGWWQVSDEASARVAVEDMVLQLERAGWPVLEQMFSREAMVARLADGDLGMARRASQERLFHRAEALMAMADGPSDTLEQALARALADLPVHDRAQRAHAERFDAWVRAQAAAS